MYDTTLKGVEGVYLGAKLVCVGIGVNSGVGIKMHMIHCFSRTSIVNIKPKFLGVTLGHDEELDLLMVAL